jgi:hypothetical protein
VTGLSFVTGGLVSGGGSGGAALPVITGSGDFGDFENAIRLWVIAATGLPTSKVIRGNQNGPRPDPPFAEVIVGDLVPVGAADAQDEVYNPAGEAGAEIAETSRGMREMTATVRIFTLSDVGPSSARALLAKVPTSLGLSVVRDILHSAGLTCFDAGTVTHVPAILDTKWEGRASLTARLYTELTASSTTGYITSVELTNTSTVPNSVTTVDAG